MVRLTLIARQRDGLPLAEGLDNDKDRDLSVGKQQAKVWTRSINAQWNTNSCSHLSPAHHILIIQYRAPILYYGGLDCLYSIAQLFNLRASQYEANRKAVHSFSCAAFNEVSWFSPYRNCLQQMFKKLAAQKSSAPDRLSAEAGAHTFHVLNSNGVAFLTLAERSYPKKLAFQYLDELANEFNRLYGGQQMESVSRPYAFIKFGAVLSLVRSCSTTMSATHESSDQACSLGRWLGLHSFCTSGHRACLLCSVLQ